MNILSRVRFLARRYVLWFTPEYRMRQWWNRWDARGGRVDANDPHPHANQPKAKLPEGWEFEF